MKLTAVVSCALFVIFFETQQTAAQIPQRLQIPGAVLVSAPNKPLPYRQPQPSPVPRLRRPIPSPVPSPLREPIRPVVEETEEDEAPTASQILDDEVNKLGLSVLQSALRTAAAPEIHEPEIQRPVPFRPERPVPVLRQDFRELSSPAPPVQHHHRQPPPQRQEIRVPTALRPTPVIRHDEAPAYRPPSRGQFIQAQPLRQAVPQRAPAPRQQQFEDDGRGRTRKPPVQILRKYRTDNEDGSITWGYENEDGSFKEETLGIDCVTRGKYGYVDPDGVKREYSYETGNKCDQPEEEELPPRPLPPQNRPNQKKPQQQYRPLPLQQPQY